MRNDGSTLLVLPDLVVLPMAGSDPRLAYAAVVAGSDDVFRVCLDAHSGATLLRYSEIQAQSAVGTGAGVNGDTKKLSVLQQAGQFVASGALCPPSLVTYDLRSSVFRLETLLGGLVPFVPSDVAGDTDNVWTGGERVLVQYVRTGPHGGHLPLLTGHPPAWRNRRSG